MDNNSDFRPQSLDDIMADDLPKQSDDAPETPQAAGNDDGNSGEPDAAPPAEQPPEQPPEPTVPRAALEDERRKRQALESHLQQLEQQFQQQQYQQQQDDQGWYDDPEQRLLQQQQRFEAQQIEMRTTMSQEFMRMQHADYDDVEAIFLQAARENPYLVAQLGQQPFPARYAYEMGTKIRDMQALANPSAETDAALDARVLAKYGLTPETARGGKKPVDPSSLPKSLASVPSATTRATAPVWDGPTPLDKLLE